MVLHSRSIEVEAVLNATVGDDAVYAALDDAYENKTPTEFAIATGDRATSGTRYRRIECQIFQLDEDYGNKEATVVKFTAKKCPGAAPSTTTVSGT